MNAALRQRFDRLVEREVAQLPDHIRALLEESPLIIEDHPDPKLLDQLGMDDDTTLCGLHTGIPLTERSVLDSGQLEYIHIFREGVIEAAGGLFAGERALAHEIRVTLLHEIGHHFGLDEDDLAALGYA